MRIGERKNSRGQYKSREDFQVINFLPAFRGCGLNVVNIVNGARILRSCPANAEVEARAEK
jgi:hypothetical protein